MHIVHGMSYSNKPAFSKNHHAIPSPVWPRAVIRFSNTPLTEQNDFDIKKIVTPPPASQISPAFLQNVENATRIVLMSLPERLRNEVIESGFRLVAAFSGKEQPISWEKFYMGREHPQLPRHPQYLKAKTVYELARKSETEQMAIVATYSQDHPFRHCRSLSPTELNQWINTQQQSLDEEIWKEAEKKGPYYCLSQNFVWLPERIKKEPQERFCNIPEEHPGWWEEITGNVEKLSRVIRHETWHYIDHLIGIRKTGMLFSQSAFRKALEEDLQVTPHSRLPHASDPGELSGNMAYYIPPLIFRYPSETMWMEPFAEAGSALTGGGMLNPQQFRQLAPRAVAMVAHLTMGEPKPQLLSPVQQWFRSRLAKWQ